MRKRELIDIKDMDVEDWRGILAIVLVVLYFVAIIAAILVRLSDAISLLIGFGGVVSIVIKWYFDSKSES